MTKKNIKPGPKPLSPYPVKIEKFIKDTYFKLSEKSRRAYAATEALKLPRGGKEYILGILGCSKNTLLRGIDEIKNPDTVLKDRIRKKGGGRKTVINFSENKAILSCFIFNFHNANITSMHVEFTPS